MKWKVKVLIQFILAHVPQGERINHLLQRAYRSRDSRMRATARRIPELCRSLALLSEYVPLQGATAVEVGTGWAPLPTLLLYLCGAREVHTYDHVRHARLALTQELLEALRKQTPEVAAITGTPEQEVRARLSRLEGAGDLEDLFDRAGIRYTAPGDATATGLPAGSVDIFYSHAVLEHVPEPVVDALTREARRVLKPAGCFYALIGLHDHYACIDRSISKVNFLQYPDWAWELFVQNDLSYHNRMRECEFLRIFTRWGGTIRHVVNQVDPADVDRVRQMKLDRRFNDLTPEECAVTVTDLLLSFVGGGREHNGPVADAAGDQPP